MRWRSLLLLCLITASCDAEPVGQPAGHPVPTVDRERAREQIQRSIERHGDPAEDAAAAARAGNFGLIVTGQYTLVPDGVACFTPDLQAPEVLFEYRHGDVIDATVSEWTLYADRYNRALVEWPGYPHADLCREATAADSRTRYGDFTVATAARPLARPPRTLHEAARRGTRGDVARLLAGADVDALDGVGMTALGWAVARANSAAFDALLEAGADPWVGGPGERDAVYWAARLARRPYFDRLQPRPGRPFSKWPAAHLGAAASGGDLAIIGRMLAQPHESLQIELLDEPLPSGQALELLLSDDPGQADALLREATDYPLDRPDLVRLALRYGADPNGKAGGSGRPGTVLGRVATGIGPGSVEMVAILLDGGADPNLMSHRERPIWEAVGTLTLGGERDENDERATAIFRMLLAAGADINLPNDQGIPAAWTLMFPYYWNRDELDASFITPALLEMLVANGLDLNARWQGKRLLSPVEQQAGRDSELAVTLRRLGARH